MKYLFYIFFCLFLQFCYSRDVIVYDLNKTGLINVKYENSKGLVVHKNIRVTVKRSDAIHEIENLEKVEIPKYQVILKQSHEDIENNIRNLQLDARKYISVRGILVTAFTLAILLPVVPGVFETTTIIGFLTMGAQRIRETKEDKTIRIVHSEILEECVEASNKLEKLRKKISPDFIKKWKTEFYNTDNYVYNSYDLFDVRIYDLTWELYKTEKTALYSLIQAENEHSITRCSFRQFQPEPETKIKLVRKEK